MHPGTRPPRRHSVRLPGLRTAHSRVRPPAVLSDARHPPGDTDMTAAGQPRHPLHALTTAELKAYRRDLERAVAFFGRQDPVPSARADLQAALDAVRAEQDERTRPAASG